MVFGEDLLGNVRRLSPLVDYVEIVLFRTPELHNLPTASEIRELKKIGAGEGIAFTVHLPASLEPASKDQNLREESLKIIHETCRQMEDLDPVHFILHLPFSAPTLVPVPGLYFKRMAFAGYAWIWAICSWAGKGCWPISGNTTGIFRRSICTASMATMNT